MAVLSYLIKKLTDFNGKPSIQVNEAMQRYNNQGACPCPYAEITAVAAPGLITLLDTALFKTYEGQLTASISSANSTLHAFLELKSQSKMLLNECICATLPSTSSSSSSSSSNTSSNTNASSKQMHQRIQSLESFARYCIECSNEAINRLTTDRLALTANIPPESKSHSNSNDSMDHDADGDGEGYEFGSGYSSNYGMHSHKDVDVNVAVTSAVRSSVEDVFHEVGMRLSPRHQHNLRKSECWESNKLFCIDYVWGDEAMLQCQRLLRAMIKHDAVDLMTAVLANSDDDTNDDAGTSSCAQTMMDRFQNVMILLRKDLPMRLQQFRNGIESDIVVSKRLYLIKNEYRAPFRSFLEGHQHVQRAPSLDLVMDYIQLHESSKKDDGAALKERRKCANQKIQDCLRNENFIKAIQLEEECEKLEVYMAKMLLPFCELARLLLDGRLSVRLVEIPGVLEGEEVLRLQELLRRLKGILSRKTNSVSGIGIHSGTGNARDSELSFGIRPLLLDLQGVPRDLSAASFELDPFSVGGTSMTLKERILILCKQLKCIYGVGKNNRFGVDKKEMESLSTDIRACANFQSEKFTKACLDWYEFSKQQRQLGMGSKER